VLSELRWSRKPTTGTGKRIRLPLGVSGAQVSAGKRLGIEETRRVGRVGFTTVAVIPGSARSVAPRPSTVLARSNLPAWRVTLTCGAGVASDVKRSETGALVVAHERVPMFGFQSIHMAVVIRARLLEPLGEKPAALQLRDTPE
jgi:hypothetical protein